MGFGWTEGGLPIKKKKPEMRGADLNQKCVVLKCFWNSSTSVRFHRSSLVQVAEQLKFAACLVNGSPYVI